MKFEDLVKRYVHLVYEQEGPSHISLKEYVEFLKTAVKFDEGGDVIVEEKMPLIDIPEETIQLLLENAHNRFNGEWLKESLKKSRHWRNLKKPLRR